MDRGGSPVSDGGRGLKHAGQAVIQVMRGFARQRWRAWIETTRNYRTLKMPHGFARQRWRAWIETPSCLHCFPCVTGSPVSDGGRGLKQAKARYVT